MQQLENIKDRRMRMGRIKIKYIIGNYLLVSARIHISVFRFKGQKNLMNRESSHEIVGPRNIVVAAKSSVLFRVLVARVAPSLNDACPSRASRRLRTRGVGRGSCY